MRRILVLGDSFTVGADVRQEESYPKVLERLLNARSPDKIEVINSGVGGWDPFIYAAYYEHYGRAFRPDLIVVGLFVGNDAYSQTTGVEEVPTAILGRRVTRGAAAHGALTTALVFLTEHFNLARLLVQRGPPMDDPTRKNCSDFSPAYLAIERAALPNHFKRDDRQLSLAQPAVHPEPREGREARRRAPAGNCLARAEIPAAQGAAVQPTEPWRGSFPRRLALRLAQDSLEPLRSQFAQQHGFDPGNY